MSRTEGLFAASAVLPSAWPRFSSENGSSTSARSKPGAPAQMKACRQPQCAAMSRAYARRAQVELPPLSEFERMRSKFAEMSKTVEPVMAKA